ncbi:MAG: 5-formyltetrahydrofolate cyclo-ligase [Hydrogenophilus sp.]|nr:5-formyltetrahydrofolate cyclo-ligase [Hydrogenophilus sp.]
MTAGLWRKNNEVRGGEGRGEWGGASSEGREERRQLRSTMASVRRRVWTRGEWQAANERLAAVLQRWWTGVEEGGREGKGGREGRGWVGLFWPLPGEPDVRGVFAAWDRRALPVTVGADEPLRFRAWREGTLLAADAMGVPAPAEGEEVRPEVVLVPFLAVDREGFRLGYGKGFYDRTLAVWRATGWQGIAAGVGFAWQVVGSVWPEPHDERLDVVVTDAGVYVPNGGR